MLQHYFPVRHFVRTAWRNLARNKVYSFINITGIAIGLATFWLIALYVGDELSYDHPFTNADRIYRIAQHANWEGGSMNLALNPPPLAPALAEKFPEVEQVVRIDAEGGGVIKFNKEALKQNDIFFADNSFFKIFDYTFLYGNAASALSQPNSTVITESLAKKIFGDVSGAYNQTIYFDDSGPVKITGVIKDVPQNSHLQFSGARSMYAIPNDQNTWQNLYMYDYILLKKGVDVNAFEKKLNAFGMQTIAKEMGIKDYRMELQPLTSIHLHSNLQYEFGSNSSITRIYIFIAIGFLILLIALINYMNLSTARSSTRVKEIGIRKVIGSSRGNLVGLFIAEALLVTFIAAFIAVFIVEASMPFFNQVSGKQLDLWRFGTFYTIAFVGAFALIAGFISGSYPALFLSHFKTIPSLKGQLGNMQTSALLRKSLVVFQFVIAVFLISGSFIIYKQMQYVNNKDLGFNKAQVLTFHIDDMKVRNEIPALKNALLQSPFIEDVAVAGNAIGDNYLGGHDFAFEKNGAMQSSSTMAKQLYVDDDFLKTMNIQLLQGRNFSKDMQTDQYGAMLINETLMKQLGYTNAIGKKSEFRVNQFADMSHRNIIGVVKDFHFSSLQHKIEPMVLMLPPAANEQDNLYVKIAKGKIAEGLGYLKKTYTKFDSQNTTDFNFLDEAFAKQYAAEQKQEQLSFVFTMLAFIIACLGLTGLVMFTVSQRIKEIGIRKVLGASVGSVTMMLGKSFMQLVLIATVIAMPVAWFAMHKWLQDFAYRIDIKWWMFLIPGLMAICVALVTVCTQAVKAALANPVKSLRTE
ncbi:ABC transporter permease [Parafilimonas terrae]|uniref:Putative ABC transport system permease protein n=1 Tax=Parafilimonas terrae TaxID=1465490 RepID=A0A1I5VQM0_9BACT|nr:ABC transporter permease [Parafilimonas terrae]SFQ09752.1 putative ABC transport system permease protein [Parafilimonas terrae]